MEELIQMQYLTVSRDIEGESGIVNLRVHDILFMEFSIPADRVVVHTMEEQFYMNGTLKYWSGMLSASGYTFRNVDRNLVNVDRIMLIDSVYKKAYFEPEIHKGSKCCTMAFKRYNKIKEELLAYNPGILII
ncbi:hypothetical protein CPT76_31990 [Paenibacillus sp. AR247]|nr:hypothetical protein CPT76_31990 [Paenibacillus sp. AR247]